MKRLTAKIREWTARRKKHWRVLHNSQARLDDLLDALDQVDTDLERMLARLVQLRREERRQEKRRDLADGIENLRGVKDQLLEQAAARRDKNVRLTRRIQKDSTRIQELKERRREIEEESKYRIGKYWHLAEFNCRIPPACPDYMSGPLNRHAELFLDKMRDRFGAGHCNSGHRWGGPPAAYDYNASIGGEPDSYHKYEERRAYPATDVTFATGTPSQWAAYARELATSYGFGGVGQYASFVHVDSRPYISNWWG